MTRQFAGVVLATLPMFATLVLLFSLRKLAYPLGLLDRPDHRKLHIGEIPTVGGLAIFGALLSVYAFSGFSLEGGALIFGMAMLVAFGVADDLRGMHPYVKLTAQLIAGLIMVGFGGLRITDLGDLLGTGPTELGWLSFPFTLFCVVGVMALLGYGIGAALWEWNRPGGKGAVQVGINSSSVTVQIVY